MDISFTSMQITYLFVYFIILILIFFSRPPIIRVHDKVMIPQEEHPDINFVGLLIGPRGNTLKCRHYKMHFAKGFL